MNQLKKTVTYVLSVKAIENLEDLAAKERRSKSNMLDTILLDLKNKLDR